MGSDPQTFAIIGAAMETHTVLGSGFLEKVYQTALIEEFRLRDIPFQTEVHLPINYKDAILECYYIADFICFNDIILEIKALDKISNHEIAQLMNYLKATGKSRGLIINFGSKSLQFERRVLS